MMIRMYLIISSLSKWIGSDGANRVKMFQIEGVFFGFQRDIVNSVIVDRQ